MLRPQNPYTAGNPVGNSPAFIGRDDVLEAVRGVLGDAQHHGIVLYGQRRIGKTSILQHLARWLPAGGGPRAVYFDLQDKAAWPVGKIMASLASTIARELGLPEPVPGPDPEAWFRKDWLPPVLGGLAEGGSLAVLLDEFDVLADTGSYKAASEAFFSALQTLLAGAAPRLKLVFVIGRNLEDLSYLAGPLFKALPSKHVSLLPREEAGRVVRMSEANGSLSWSDGAVEATWALTHGHPYLLQHLCWQVWQRARAKGEPKGAVTAAEVEAAVSPTLDASRNALQWLWDGLPPAGRVVASALAKAGPGAISEERLRRVLTESGVRLVIRDLTDAPKLLQEWDLLEAVDGGHRFLVELLRRWIAQYKPLSRVQEELDKINPFADTLYQGGEAYYRNGKFDQAVAQLREALEINPRHLKASELLAEILIDRSAWDEAQQVLERLRESYSGGAGPQLVRVFLGRAQAATDEAKRLSWYEKALELDGQDTAAIEGKRAVWKDRGDRARAEGKFAEAAKAYAEAKREDLLQFSLEELRTLELERVRAEVLRLEETEHYEEALDAIRQAAGLHDWAPDVERLTRAARTLADYQRASGALKEGDRETAMRLFAGVVAVDPRYKEVSKLLYEAVSGTDVNRREQDSRETIAGFMRAAATQNTAREEAEAATENARAALVVERAAYENVRATAWADSQAAQAAQVEATARLERAKQKQARFTALAVAQGLAAIALSGWIVFKMPHAPAAVGTPPPASASVERTVKPPPASSPDAALTAEATPVASPADCPPGMAFIPGGAFTMGSEDTADEKPPHAVTVASFCMDVTEVTVEAYSEWVKKDVRNKPAGTRSSSCNGTKSDRLNHPINCVNWTQADAFCKAQEKKRLPTEEEWEYAARGGNAQRTYPWGDAPPPGSQLCWGGEGNDLGNGKRTTTCPVRKYPDGDAKGGLHDMAGNVWEWTSSYYCPYDGKKCANDRRVVRGGSCYDDNAANMRAMRRNMSAPEDYYPGVGFRCARITK